MRIKARQGGNLAMPGCGSRQPSPKGHAQWRSYTPLNLLLAGTAVGIRRSRCSGAVQMRASWIGDLNDVTVLPAISLGISCRNTNVSPLSF